MTATRSDGTGARRAGAAATEFDLTAHWRERARGREGWDNAPALVRDLSTRFTATVAEAIERAGGVPGRTETEFVAATWYGTSHVAEVMHEQLREAGPKWLDPEQFLHYSPHAMVSAAALDLGLGGASATLVGPDAEFQAVAHAVRRIRSGRAATVVVAEYEALTPFAAAPCPDGPGTAAGAPRGPRHRPGTDGGWREGAVPDRAPVRRRRRRRRRRGRAGRACGHHRTDRGARPPAPAGGRGGAPRGGLPGGGLP